MRIPPFQGPTEEAIFQNILDTPHSFEDGVWGTVSEEAKDFIDKLLTRDLAKRPTAQQALEHLWIKSKVDSDVVEELQLTNSLINLKKF